MSPRSPKTGTPTGSGTTTGRSGRPKARSCSADSSSRSPPTSRATCRPRCAGSSATACGPAGLLAEEYDVTQRQLRGNLPQAFVHALLLECATRLNE
ncbi:glycoside hydrolase family 15 protein [Nonomuraea jabiensis]|uniref:glycoside hydrolase family 15 protein n=1 Tax=Nonomuraea jabiensis TaxID=882448 RepID=UPI003F4E3984